MHPLHTQVGVHIADVSYFVREGTPLDVEAARRATTVSESVCLCGCVLRVITAGKQARNTNTHRPFPATPR